MSVLSGVLGVDVSALLTDSEDLYESLTIKGRGRYTVWQGFEWLPARRVRAKLGTEWRAAGLVRTRRLIPPKDRHVMVPQPALAAAQRLIMERMIGFAPPHPAATAFWVGRSIKKNAALHHRPSYLFKTDFKNFFQSITADHVARSLVTQLPHLSRVAVSEVVKLTTAKGTLPLGASTSPHLSNLVMRDFDEAVSREAERLGAVYTRYADDIAVSAESRLVIQELDAFILDRTIDIGLARHEGKTRTFGPHEARIVTGLDVSRAQIRPPKVFRKRVQAMTRICVINPRRSGKLMPRIVGSICYWHDIEPRDPDLVSLLSIMRENFPQYLPASMRVGPVSQQEVRFDPQPLGDDIIF